MLFKRKSVLLVPIVIFIGITVFAICYTYSGNSNYSVYEKFIKAETIHFNFKDRTLPLFLDDSTCSLADMAAFENQGYLKAQNPDSLFLKIKKVFPSIQLETVNDFYAKNENNSNINSEKLSLLIKVRNFFIISNSHNYTLEICFSNVGFNNDKTQAIIYVHSSYYEVTDNTMYIYNRKFGCWIKSVEINVSTILWGSEFMQNDKVPPPPPFEDSVLAPKN